MADDALECPACVYQFAQWGAPGCGSSGAYCSGFGGGRYATLRCCLDCKSSSGINQPLAEQPACESQHGDGAFRNGLTGETGFYLHLQEFNNFVMDKAVAGDNLSLVSF